MSHEKEVSSREARIRRGLARLRLERAATIAARVAHSVGHWVRRLVDDRARPETTVEHALQSHPQPQARAPDPGEGPGTAGDREATPLVPPQVLVEPPDPSAPPPEDDEPPTLSEARTLISHHYRRTVQLVGTTATSKLMESIHFRDARTGVERQAIVDAARRVFEETAAGAQQTSAAAASDADIETGPSGDGERSG